MKLTTQEAMAAFVTIKELPKLPVKASYRLNRFATLLQPHLEAYEKERAALAQELGTPNKDKQGAYDIPPDKLEEFATQLNSLMDEEIDVTLEPVKVADLGNVELAPAALMALGKLVEE